MSMKMSVNDDEIDLKLLINDSKIVGDKILRVCGKVVKAKVERNLSAIKYFPINKDGSQGKRPRDIHMADDVQTRIVEDKFGYRTMKISGGRSTGPLWHIVNDGTFNSSATHFMDNAISQSQPEIESIIDAEMRKQGF